MMMAEKNASDRNQEGLTIYRVPLPILRLLDSNKDMWMDSNQGNNLIRIGQNNPKRNQGSQIVRNTHAVFTIF